MKTIEQKIKSQIPTPVARTGYSIPRVERKLFAYNGTTLTHFLHQNGGNWHNYRQFLKANRIGRVTGLEEGRQVSIEQVSKIE